MQLSHYETLYKGELEHWWYRVRRVLIRQLVESYLRKNPGLKNNLKILDVGCGTGALLKELEVYGEVYGIDMSDQALDFCRQRGLKNLHNGDATHIPFTDQNFDIVLALDVLEHVEDDSSAAREIARVLKFGGQAVFFVPAFMILWGITDVLSQHYRRYTLSSISTVVKSAGLKVSRSSYFNFFLFPPILLVRLTVRLLHLKVGSENEITKGPLNGILYFIFRLEAFFLKYITFPFGVSSMVIAKK